jgi:phage gpG-like protein
MLTMTLRSEDAQKHLLKIARTVENPAPINRKVSIALYGVVMRNFRDQGNNGTPWMPLAAGGRWKGRGKRRSRDTDAKILMDTGALRQSFSPFHDNGQAGVGAQSYVPKKGGDGPAELSAIHEYGTTRIPSRPMLPTITQGLDIALTIYGQEIARSVKGAAS